MALEAIPHYWQEGSGLMEINTGQRALKTENLLVRKNDSSKGLIEALPFLLPAAIFYIVFVIYPMVATVQLSFYKWNGFATVAKTFVGFANFIYIFTKDTVFWTSFKNSLIWMGLSLIIPTTIGLLFAIILNQNIPGRNFFRTLIYLPSVLAPIAVATMWRWMYDPNYGIVNSLLNAIGTNSLVHNWLADPNTVLLAVFIASAWVTTGVTMVLFVAGLQNVSDELIDAAKVDGAGKMGIFWNVTVPALKPTFVIVFVTTIINSLKVFDLVVGMTFGGPAQKTQVMALWSYQQSFRNHMFGYGTAISTILLIMTVIIVVPYLIWNFREEGSL